MADHIVQTVTQVGVTDRLTSDLGDGRTPILCINTNALAGGVHMVYISYTTLPAAIKIGCLLSFNDCALCWRWSGRTGTAAHRG